MDAHFPQIKGNIMKFYFLSSRVALIEGRITHVSTSFWVVWHEDGKKKTANPIAFAVSRASVSPDATTN
jgi:hypothetical protein